MVVLKPNFKIDAVEVLASGKYSMCDANGNVDWKTDVVDIPTKEQIDAKAQELEIAYNIETSRREYMDALHVHLDARCAAKGFIGDSQTKPFRSISNYVGYDNAFRADAELLGVWIANCFLISEAIEKDVANNSREMPSIEVFLSEMPK